MFLSYPRAEVCLVTVVRSDVDGGRASVFSSVWERQWSLREKLPPCQRSSSCLVFSSTQESIFFCQHLALKRGKWLSAASFFTSQWWDQYEKCGATQKVWTRLSRSVRSYLSELVSLEIVVDLYLISAAGYGLARLDPHIHCFYLLVCCSISILIPYETESIHKCQKSIRKRRNWPARDVQRVI